MRTLLKLIILILFLATLAFYLLPLVNVIKNAIESFEMSIEWVDALFSSMRVVMVLRTDLLLIMILQILCIIALKGKKM